MIPKQINGERPLALFVRGIRETKGNRNYEFRISGNPYVLILRAGGTILVTDQDFLVLSTYFGLKI